MKKKGLFLLLIVVFLLATESIQAQCSICTKTASQLGEGPAKALNSAIIYLAFAPIGHYGLYWFPLVEKRTNHYCGGRRPKKLVLLLIYTQIFVNKH
jgi:hypothetical protein